MIKCEGMHISLRGNPLVLATELSSIMEEFINSEGILPGDTIADRYECLLVLAKIAKDFAEAEEDDGQE